MKVGVFGDSFAHTIFYAPEPYDKLPNQNFDYKEYHWAYHLSKKLGADTVDFFAQAGSSFYFSYKKIFELGHNYDQIIFVVTNPYRFPTCLGDNWGINAGNISNTVPSDVARDLKGWFNLSDNNYLEDVQEAFIAKLESKFNNIIYIPSFRPSFNEERHIKNRTFGEFNLHAFHTKFTEKINMKGPITRWEYFDTNRVLCHIPTLWHEPISQIIYNHIKHGTELTVPDLHLEILDMNHYYLPKI
jgi:hypothetical protein